MDTLLLGITVVSLVVALVMSVTAWRLMREEKRRSLARIAALSATTTDDAAVPADLPIVEQRLEPQIVRTPWRPAVVEAEEKPSPVSVSHASGIFGAAPQVHDHADRQKTLAVAAVVFFVCLVGGTAWVMSAPEGTSAVAVGPNSPLELVSLTHSRQNQKLAVSGLVRNPVSGKPVERLSAVVFLFDPKGTFVTSSKAHVDFLRLGAGDESPFVVSLDAPANVSRYRVSFRTDDGVVPHIDRRGESPAPAEGEQSIAVTTAR
ncbi:MAG TPA: hypothetical protein VJ691_13660 [Vicinamibacterales bacterium]|nr:hypothetical protein [Vicinamibacterales bacterium]